MSKKYFIIGSSGFIGTQLKKISTNDYQCVDRKDVDLLNIKTIKHYFGQFDTINTVIFLVGLVHKKGAKGTYDQHLQNNHNTLKNLIIGLREINKIPKKIIFTSTVNVYGRKPEVDKFYENSNTYPSSYYAKTKKSAEELIIKSNIANYWILRLAPVYSDNFQININKRTQFLNIFYHPGNKKIKFSLCNVKNIVLSIESILEDKVPSGIYNISDKPSYTYDDLLKYKNARVIIYIPKFLFKFLFKFLGYKKNELLLYKFDKLISSNIFPSRKIRKYINITEKLC